MTTVCFFISPIGFSLSQILNTHSPRDQLNSTRIVNSIMNRYCIDADILFSHHSILTRHHNHPSHHYSPTLLNGWSARLHRGHRERHEPIPQGGHRDGIARRHKRRHGRQGPVPTQPQRHPVERHHAAGQVCTRGRA